MKCCQIEVKKIPVITKCCFCVPIRKGVIIFGYFNLVLSLLSFPLLTFLLVEGLTGKPVPEKGYLEPLVHLPVTIAFVVVDVVMTIVLLIGAHKRKRILLQVYFYFGIVFQMVTLCMDLIYFDFREYIENTVYFSFLGLNIYLLFLVYNTLQILQENRDVHIKITCLIDKICNHVEVPILTKCCFCLPLRKGLIAFAYTNLMLTLAVTCLLSMYISYIRNSQADLQDASEFPRLIADTTALVLEFAMTIVFIVALHMKHVLLMKLYLYFEIVFAIIGFIYSLAFLVKETSSELFLILFQLMVQIYLVILIWSSIVKMQRDDTVKYTREP